MGGVGSVESRRRESKRLKLWQAGTFECVRSGVCAAGAVICLSHLALPVCSEPGAILFLFSLFFWFHTLKKNHLKLFKNSFLRAELTASGFFLGHSLWRKMRPNSSSEKLFEGKHESFLVGALSFVVVVFWAVHTSHLSGWRTFLCVKHCDAFLRKANIWDTSTALVEVRWWRGEENIWCSRFILHHGDFHTDFFVR